MQEYQQKILSKKSEKKEQKTNSEFVLDSCIWIGYFTGDKKEAKFIVESNNHTNYTSVLSIFEFIIKMKKAKIPNIIIDSMISLIETNSIILEVNKQRSANK